MRTERRTGAKRRKLISLALLACIGFASIARAAPPPASAPTAYPPLRPFTAYAWSHAPLSPLLPHVIPMIWVKPDTLPGMAARQAQVLPPDERVILLFGTSALIAHNPADFEPGTHDPSPWMIAGAAHAQRWSLHFWQQFRWAGGSVDFVAQDNEAGVSLWGMHKQQQVDELLADPRWAPVARRFGIAGRRPLLGAVDGPLYLAVDAALNSICAGYFRQAFLDPLRQVFPDAGTSEWGDELLPKDQVGQARDINGWAAYSVDPLYGTVQSPYFYALPGNVAWPGRNDGTNPDFSASPLPTLCWEITLARTLRHASDVPILPWIASCHGVTKPVSGTPYYDEMIRHLVLGGQSPNLLLWNVPPARYLAGDDADVNAVLADLAAHLRSARFTCFTLQPVPFNSKQIITGVRCADGRRLFRITLAPGVTAADITLPGESSPTHIQLPANQAGVWIERSS